MQGSLPSHTAAERPEGGGPHPRIARHGHASFDGNLHARPVHVGAVVIGGARPAVIAGPCAVEGRAQTLRIARAVAEAGADMLRGGAYKPRTSPYDFQGLGREGLEILAEAREATGLPIVTEVIDPRLVPLVARYADVLQVGARNMQNFPLLREVGRTGMPVLLKRHWGASLAEWLCAAEYVAAEGNLDIVLCERGIRTFSEGEYNRSTLDLNVIPAARALTFLPVIADPSHGTGRVDMVPGMAAAALAVGAHGLIIEVIAEETDEDEPLCDGFQSIKPSVLRALIAPLHAAAPFVPPRAASAG